MGTLTGKQSFLSPCRIIVGVQPAGFTWQFFWGFIIWLQVRMNCYLCGFMDYNPLFNILSGFWSVIRYGKRVDLQMLNNSNGIE